MDSELFREREPCTASDHEIHDRQVGALFSKELFCLGDGPDNVDVVALGAQEILGEIRRVRITFDEQNAAFSRMFGLVHAESLIPGEAFFQSSMRVCGAQS